MPSPSNPIYRTDNVCDQYNISFVRYISDDNHVSVRQRKLKQGLPFNDGVSDSVRQL